MFIEYLGILSGAAVLGAIFGSFVNVVAIRSHEDLSLSGRSKCMNCKTALQKRHLVPVLSWIFQRGRCAFCKKPIHIQYPLVEMAAAFLGVLAVTRHLPGLDWNWISFEFFFSISLLIFLVMDARWYELPVELMVGVGVVFSVWHMLLRVAGGEMIFMVGWSHTLGLGAATFFFLLQWIVSRKRWIGSGDIWLAAALGAVLGWPGVGIAVYFAYLFGGGAAVLLLLLKRIQPGARVPFAPALVAGALAAMWWTPIIQQWISHAFL